MPPSPESKGLAFQAIDYQRDPKKGPTTLLGSQAVCDDRRRLDFVTQTRFRHQTA